MPKCRFNTILIINYVPINEKKSKAVLVSITHRYDTNDNISISIVIFIISIEIIQGHYTNYTNQLLPLTAITLTES